MRPAAALAPALLLLLAAAGTAGADAGTDLCICPWPDCLPSCARLVQMELAQAGEAVACVADDPGGNLAACHWASASAFARALRFAGCAAATAAGGDPAGMDPCWCSSGWTDFLAECPPPHG